MVTKTELDPILTLQDALRQSPGELPELLKQPRKLVEELESLDALGTLDETHIQALEKIFYDEATHNQLQQNLEKFPINFVPTGKRLIPLTEYLEVAVIPNRVRSKNESSNIKIARKILSEAYTKAVSDKIHRDIEKLKQHGDKKRPKKQPKLPPHYKRILEYTHNVTFAAWFTDMPEAAHFVTNVLYESESNLEQILSKTLGPIISTTSKKLIVLENQVLGRKRKRTKQPQVAGSSINTKGPAINLINEVEADQQEREKLATLPLFTIFKQNRDLLMLIGLKSHYEALEDALGAENINISFPANLRNTLANPETGLAAKNALRLLGVSLSTVEHMWSYIYNRRSPRMTFPLGHSAPEVNSQRYWSQPSYRRGLVMTPYSRAISKLQENGNLSHIGNNAHMYCFGEILGVYTLRYLFPHITVAPEIELWEENQTVRELQFMLDRFGESPVSTQGDIFTYSENKNQHLRAHNLESITVWAGAKSVTTNANILQIQEYEVGNILPKDVKNGHIFALHFNKDPYTKIQLAPVLYYLDNNNPPEIYTITKNGLFHISSVSYAEENKLRHLLLNHLAAVKLGQRSERPSPARGIPSIMESEVETLRQQRNTDGTEPHFMIIGHGKRQVIPATAIDSHNLDPNRDHKLIKALRLAGYEIPEDPFNSAMEYLQSLVAQGLCKLEDHYDPEEDTMDSLIIKLDIMNTHNYQQYRQRVKANNNTQPVTLRLGHKRAALFTKLPNPVTLV